MKTTIILLMGIALFFSNHATAQTVIYQSDFETWTGSYPDGWGGPGTTISPDSVIPYTTFPHSGTKACRLENRTGNWDTLFSTQTVNLIKGHSYSINFWVRGKGYVYIILDSIAGSSIHADTLNWKEVKSNNNFISAQNSPNTKLFIRVYHTDSTKDDIQIDDIAILDYGLYQTYLDTNNIAAMVNANGSLFWDIQGSERATFYAPKNSGKTSMYAAGLWMSGLDTLDSIHVAAVHYDEFVADYQIGPIANDYSSSAYITKYHKLWKIDKSVIDYHILHYNVPGYNIPDEILNWPGNGDVSNGEAATLAPFVDLNGNGIYEPALGDYPYIRGDQAIYFILNDDISHTESKGRKFGLEENVMLYSFNQPSDSALYNTIFLTYNIINRSDTDYHDVNLGFWTDADLGSWSDDYIGSDSTLSFFYEYNGDEMDGDGNGQTYGAHPPAQGIAFLNHPMSKFMYFYNASGSPQSDPSTAQEYSNYLHGKWKDGTPLTYGGSGYGGTVLANYMFNGLFDGGWSEESINNTPGDRRGVGSVGPFNLPSKGSLCLEIAFPFARDYQGTRLTSAFLLRQRVQAIKTFFDAQNYDCLTAPQGIQALNQSSNAITVFPNPSDGIFTVHQEGTPQQATLFIYNVLGQCVYSSKINADDTFVNLSTQPAGFYHYRITDNQHYTHSGKIIIK